MTLRLTSFTAGYGRIRVVRDINLEIAEGQIVGLSAPTAPERPR